MGGHHAEAGLEVAAGHGAGQEVGVVRGHVVLDAGDQARQRRAQLQHLQHNTRYVNLAAGSLLVLTSSLMLPRLRIPVA